MEEIFGNIHTPIIIDWWSEADLGILVTRLKGEIWIEDLGSMESGR